MEKSGSLVFQLLAQFPGVDQVAVVGQDNVLSLVVGQEGLGIAAGGTARGGIAHMAHGYPAGEGAQAGLGKDVRHQAHALVLVHAVRIQGNDARALLAPVLLGVEAEIGQTGRVLMIINTEKTAFVPNHNHLLLQFFRANAQCDYP